MFFLSIGGGTALNSKEEVIVRRSKIEDFISTELTSLAKEMLGEVEKLDEWWRENKDDMDSSYSVGIDVAITTVRQKQLAILKERGVDV